MRSMLLLIGLATVMTCHGTVNVPLADPVELPKDVSRALVDSTPGGLVPIPELPGEMTPASFAGLPPTASRGPAKSEPAENQAEIGRAHV